jgi:L-ascorbate metabolism protein UlaG (beta-lactamase superfamily)/glycosyltransferase involved in cell wall biosynthesis
MRIPVKYLGQSGWRLKFPTAVIYLDPYLSNSVQELDAPDLKRLRSIPFPPESVCDADYVLITHEHMDHCDPYSIPAIAEASPNAQFLGPKPVIDKLRQWGIVDSRLHIAPEDWIPLGEEGIKVCATPAAHLEVERDENRYLKYIGFLISFQDKKIYFAGDTCLTLEVIDAVMAHTPIHIAVLPVNEHNYFRAKRGIVGNMSVREALQFSADIGVKNMVAVHWDMFEVNSVFPEEIRLIHTLINPNFSLSLNPCYFDLDDINVSIVIRTFNEEKYLEELLRLIGQQKTRGLNTEVVIVDSGSTDKTIEIANKFNCHIERISKNEFSFGRSLNIGCRAAVGDILVIVSGHCVPVNQLWLQRLCQPIVDGEVEYVYGRQHGGQKSYFSEIRIFAKYFSEISTLPQEGFFCNNANSAIARDVWMSHLFDEDLTGLEDMELAQRLLKAGSKLGYVADAGVYHYHNETWRQVRLRFKRESIALQKIMPQLHLSLWDALRYILVSCYKDWRALLKDVDRSLKARDVVDIIFYRFNQYIGSWQGNHEHRKLSLRDKEKYFFPN